MKILIIGHARHGKDTVATMIKQKIKLDFEGSSECAARIFIYDALKKKYKYNSYEECFEDRVNHRQEWYELICDYNKDDAARLAKDILTDNDMYVGMRSDRELEECKRQGLFDIIIGVYDPDKPKEPESSFNIDLFKHSDIVIITGDINKTEKTVDFICNSLK